MLCGGRVPLLKPTPDDLDPPIGSLRHAITNTLTEFEVFRPEEITDWHADGVFKDLVSFELELAAICSLVVIIPESEGSLVELGAFSQLPELAEKSMIVCFEEFANEKSFINMGILRFLRATSPSRVRTYPWNIATSEDVKKEIIEDVISDVNEELEKLPGSQVLRIDKKAHSSIVICELIRFFVALKEGEILQYLDLMGLQIKSEKLREKLFLLERFRLIKTQQFSDSIFYMTADSRHHKLRVSLTNGDKPFDDLRMGFICKEVYKSDPKFRNWNRAISQSTKVMR